VTENYNTIFPHEVKRLSKISEELKDRPQWVAWRKEERDGKSAKIPYQPQNPIQKASSTNPNTWGIFEQALSVAQTNGFHGIGYVFSPQDDYAGVDLDKCRNPETGEIERWARAIINRLNSYTEISPSGCGVHVLLKGKLPEGPRRNGNVEMYDSGRYFTMTGLRLEGTPTAIEDRQEEVAALHAEHFPQAVIAGSQVTQELGPGPALPDEEILSLATQSVNFEPLWEGDWQGPGYVSASEGDLALCAILARHTQNPAQIDRIFRESRLMRPKWDERHGEKTYGQKTIEKALGSPPLAPQGGLVGGRAKPRSGPSPISAAELEKMEFPEPRWAVPGLIPEGYTLMAGQPKVGKSWLALNLALSVASGKKALVEEECDGN